MTREELLKQATAAVCAGVLADYRAGRITEEKLAELIARRKPQIADWMRDRAAAANARPVVCADCGRAATTRMNSADYCDDHAKNHRLAEPLRRFA